MNTATESSSNVPPASPPRLPSDLFTCYKQYKANTDRLASWLGATASSLGYSFPDPRHARTHGANDSLRPVNMPPSGRLKGKARKAAANGSPTTGSGGGPASRTSLIGDFPGLDLGSDDDCTTAVAAAPPPTLLNTNQFVELARFITAVDQPPVSVPSRIIGWARAAIKSRRLCADWFGSSQTGDLAVDRSNQTHQHFIEVLEQVVDILATRVGRSVKQQQSAAAGIEFIANRFSALEVEGSEHDCDSADAVDDVDWDAVDTLVNETVAGQPAQRAEEPTGVRQRYRVKLRDEDAELALLDHLFELHRTRHFIRETWQQYVDGALTLEVASLVTLAATDKMQLAHDALVEMSPALVTDPARVLDRLTLHVVRGIVDKDGGEPSAEQWIRDGVRPEYLSFSEETDILDLTFLGVSDMIVSMIQEFRSGRMDEDSEIHAGEKPFNRADLMVWRGAVLACEYARWKSTDEGGGECYQQSPASICLKLDALIATRTATSIDSSPSLSTIPLPTQFAVLVFFDVRDLTRNHHRRIESSLTSACQPHSYAIDQYLAHVAPGTPHTRHTRGMIRYAKEVRNPMLWWCKHDKHHMRPIFRTFLLFDFSSNHWLAGSFAVSCHVYNTGIGAIVAQDAQYVSGAAYLYWAIQHMGLAAGGKGDAEADAEGSANAPWSWPLMGDLIALTRDGEGIFFGGPPRSAADACRAFMIVLGSNPLDVSRVYRNWHKAGGKRKQSTPAQPVYYSPKRLDLKKAPDRFAGGLWKKRDVLRPLVLRAMGVKDVAKMAKAWEEAVVHGMSSGDRSAAANAVESPHLAIPIPLASEPASNSATRQRSRSQPSLSLEESLSQLRKQLTANLPALAINVLLLHVHSYRILKHVRSRLKDYFGPAVRQDKSYFHQDEDLACWAMFLLHMLAAKEDTFFGQKRGPKKIERDWDMAIEVLGEVKELIQTMVDECAEEYARVISQRDLHDYDYDDDDESDAAVEEAEQEERDAC